MGAAASHADDRAAERHVCCRNVERYRVGRDFEAAGRTPGSAPPVDKPGRSHDHFPASRRFSSGSLTHFT